MFIKLDDISGISLEKLDKLYMKHYNSAFYKVLELTNTNVHFDTAEGINVWDTGGKKYLDFLGGFGALNIGHNNPSIIGAIEKYLSKPNLVQQSENIYNGVLGNNISFLTHDKLKVCSMTNSGTESVEEAIKLAFMYKKGGTIVYCSNAYHGKTIGSISAFGNNLKNKFPNLNRTFIEVPFGDIHALAKVIRKYKVAAFLVEPIQAEAGVIVPPPDYFKKVKAICQEHEVVLILDEVQTGLGRCGTMFCYEQFGIIPDIMCLSKSLGGGIIPVGCIAVEQKIWDSTYGKIKNASLPSTTFGGNTLASIAAIETLTVIMEEKLCKKAERLGAYALKKLNELKKKHKMITDVRGKGLLIGIEIDRFKKMSFKTVKELEMFRIISKMLNEHNIICGFTSNNPSVLRFEPPLTINKREIDYFVQSLDEVLSEERNETHLFIESLISTGKEFVK